MLTTTHKHHIISIQCPSHICLPEKSCLYCLRILIMSCLFKDPISSGLAQFDHAQSNIKFFSRKISNKIFMHLLVPFILLKFLKNSQSRSRVMRMCHFRTPKMAHSHNSGSIHNSGSVKVTYYSINEILTIREY